MRFDCSRMHETGNSEPTRVFPSQAQPVAPGTTADLSKGYAAIVATVAIWSTPSLFMYYLTAFYDPYAQNFYRYAFACVAVLPFLLGRVGQPRTPLTPELLGTCGLIALPNVVHQVTQVMALTYMGPGVFSIFMRSTVIITAVLVLVFFPDERWIVRQWQFVVGTLLGLAGAIGILWFQPGVRAAHLPIAGAVMAVLASGGWSLYSVLVKRPSAQLGPVRSFAVISAVTSVLLLPLTLLFGNIATPLHVNLGVNSVLILSAVTCISIAHVLYYVAIRELGVALSQTLQLLCPLFALALSAWIFGEKLSAPQLWCALLLLAGAFLATQVRPRRTVAAAEAI